MEKIAQLLPVYRFNTVVNIWQNLKPNIPEIVFPKKSLKFITYNIWFEDFNFDNRAEELCNIMQKSNADYICLQEVTSNFLKILIQKAWCQENYYISLRDPFYGYTVMLLSKYPFGLYNISFPSEMGRSLLYGVVNLSGKNFAVATSHFESLNTASTRAKQLAITFDILNKYDFGCLMGDFNFDNSVEDALIDKNFRDIWKVFNDIKKDPGHTMPATDRFSAWRPDKFLLKNHDNLKPKSIKIIGKEPIPEKKMEKLENDQISIKNKVIIKKIATYVLTPSDHYGLEIDIEFC